MVYIQLYTEIISKKQQKRTERNSEIIRLHSCIGDMFRIIRIEIESEAFIQAGKTSRDTVERLCEVLDLQSSNGVFCSEAMATTSTKYLETMDCLKALFSDDNNWNEIDYSTQYVLVRTRAPRDYDYGYCVDVGTVGGAAIERLVAVPAGKLEYQSGRYSSGMYMPTVCS
jgi:hypothetical protein